MKNKITDDNLEVGVGVGWVPTQISRVVGGKMGGVFSLGEKDNVKKRNARVPFKVLHKVRHQKKNISKRLVRLVFLGFR